MAIALIAINSTVQSLAKPQRCQPQQSMPAAHTWPMRTTLSVGLQHDLLDAIPAVRVLCRPESLSRHGGLVMTGRLEDVCAELDRLVAMEELH